MRALHVFPVVSILLAMCSCIAPVQYNATNREFLDAKKGERTWRRIAVLPFSGDPAFRGSGSEWFAHLVGKQHLFDIVGPSLAEIELAKKGIKPGTADIPVGEAREAGRILGVDGVVVGSLKTATSEWQDMFWGKKVAGASLVDVTTGEVVATSARSSVLTGTNTVDVAANAIEQVVNDLLPALYGLAGKTWIMQPKKEATHQPWNP